MWGALLEHPMYLSCSDHTATQPSECQASVAALFELTDLERLDGLAPLVGLLAASPRLQAAAAVVLGTAASNNHKFQQQLMQAHPEVLEQLMQVRCTDWPCFASCFAVCWAVPVCRLVHVAAMTPPPPPPPQHESCTY